LQSFYANAINRPPKRGLLAVADRFHYEVDAENIYIDIITGYSIGEDRPNYSALLEEVDKGNIGIILFSELTRLGRNSTELLAEVQRLQDKGVELYFEKQDLWVKNDKKDLGSRILLAVLAITTSYEIELFAERSISGKINKITKGGGVGGDNNAYGYMNDENKMMVIREDEAEIIRRIFNMYADGKSTIEICDILNTEGIPTSYGTRLAEFKENRQRKGIEPKEYKHFKNGEDFKWRPSSIAKLLAKDLYKGHRFVQFRKPQVDKLEKKNGEPVEPEIAFTYDVQLEKLRIVDDELFQRVQDRLAQAAYNKNNAIKHENLLKAKLICGECGSRFSVGKQSDTAIKYKVNPRTYKCYGLVDRKDHPRICTRGMETRQWRLDGLVLTLSLHMFAEINIAESNTNKIGQLTSEIEDMLKIKDAKEKELNTLREEHRRAMTRLAYIKDDEETVREIMANETTSFNTKQKELAGSINKYAKGITEKKVTISKLRNLTSSFFNIKDKIDEIHQNKELVKAMIDEYIEDVTIYKIHKLWNLIIVHYTNGAESWGTIKNARYKNDETFYDEAFCHYGIEFRSWIINNNDHSFTYDKDNQTVQYSGKSEIYRQLQAGTYTYEEFDNMLAENDWIGSYPLYAYEEYPSEQVPNDDKEQQPTSDIDWNKHNEQVLEKLRQKEQQEKDLQIALEPTEA
jgi:DNA invertase Pin-like site-specific DNA recombinase